MLDVLVVGAGLCGVVAASELAAQGLQVQLLDKARGPGGRLCSQRSEFGALDVGAQYFTARHPEFLQKLAQWQHLKQVALWSPRIARYEQGVLSASPDQEHRFVGVPNMQQLAKDIHPMVDAQWQQQLLRCQFANGVWTCETAQQQYQSKALLLTLPPAQADALVGHIIDLPTSLLQPCLAWQWVVEREIERPFDAIFSDDPVLKWLCRQTSKPARAESPEIWSLHCTAEFSALHWQTEEQAIYELVMAAWQRVVGEMPSVTQSRLKRWRYASVDPQQPPPGLMTSVDSALCCAGDWSFGGRVENAYLAGRHAAHWLLSQRKD